MFFRRVHELHDLAAPAFDFADYQQFGKVLAMTPS